MASKIYSEHLAERVSSTFLVRPMYEGKTFPCFESGFNATREESIRVRRMEDMRLGIEKCTTQQFEEYLGKQPVFYFQERFADGELPSYEWNGFLLFAIRGTETARKTALAHKDELHIILSFDDPDYDRYYILVDTGTGGGTPGEFLKWQEDVRDLCLKKYFHKPLGFNTERFTRALTPDHYDIVDVDVLFGKPMPAGDKTSAEAVHQMSVFALILTTIERLFKKCA